ncbi:hypothetical protein CDD81_7711 [Ophiocordyceps australis]|uniref:O-methyltransferase n=1 Tax=Ophiocordyceps australis TaxID=1399860 RepID=A0A2C5Y403_9HYPO|nr:hypothetical protein CDD81_7711 [Ophiocordyceps australis]
MSLPNLANLPGMPSHIIHLLNRLHAESSTQEAKLTLDFHRPNYPDELRDKYFALDKDKAHFIYALCRATDARTIVEAGTSHGVSTIYLALAAAANAQASGPPARVITTENVPPKAAAALQNWKSCGEAVCSVIELRQGDVRETLQQETGEIDFLLLDIWVPVAFSVLKLLQPRLRRGAIVVVDSTARHCDDYAELLAHVRAPESGFVTQTLPFRDGLEMMVYMPEG